MNKLTAAAICLLFSLFIISCQKEASEEVIQPGTGGGGANSGGNYFPLTEGSWWKYKDSITGKISTQKMLKITKTINNIKYTGYQAVLGTITDTAWAAAPQPNYYISAEGVSPNTGATYDLTFHYLNDTASVGYNWTYTAGHGNGFTAYIKTTILERNISTTVSGKTYSNVIHTSLDFSYELFGTPMEVGTYHYYTAKGIGIIKVVSEFHGGGISFRSSNDLMEYHIQ